MDKQNLEKRLNLPLRTVFVGNESAFLDVITSYSRLETVVCTKNTGKAASFFGSAFAYARRNGIEIAAPEEFIAHPHPTDLIIVAGYPRLIPGHIIKHPSVGIINIHMSLLPAYRGRHPLNWAIINGEKHAGVTIHHLNEKFDEGNIICQERITIKPKDTIMEVHAKAVKKGRTLLKKTFGLIGSKQFRGFRQELRQASYFPPRTPKDSKINWRDPAVKILNLVRALAEPYPGAYFYYKGEKWILDKAELVPDIHRQDVETGKPFLYNACYTIKTGDGFLKLVRFRKRGAEALQISQH